MKKGHWFMVLIVMSAAIFHSEQLSAQEASGVGVSDNNTAEGRSVNRRVEIDVR